MWSFPESGALFLSMSSLAAAGFLHIPFSPPKQPSHEFSPQIRGRQVSTPLSTNKDVPRVKLMVGSPPQEVIALVDSDSPDLWVNTECTALVEVCYDPNESSSFVDKDQKVPRQYQDSTKVTLNLMTDDVQVGGFRLENTRMYYVSDLSPLIDTPGILGLEPGGRRQQLIKHLVEDGHINSRVVSVNFGHVDESPGALLFGAIDTKKYRGQLQPVPINTAASPEAYRKYWVDLNSIAFTSSTGTSQTLFDERIVVLLDSGFERSYIPRKAFKAMAAVFPTMKMNLNSDFDSTDGRVDCDYDFADSGTLDFRFGDATIHIPLNDLIYRSNTYCSTDFKYRAEGSNSEDSLILGINFFRGTYVTFDQDNEIIYMADGEDCGSNIVEVGSGPNAVPLLPGCGSGNGGFPPGKPFPVPDVEDDPPFRGRPFPVPDVDHVPPLPGKPLPGTK